ncbi:MAG TPA: chemotaxis protein CheB [Pilimelia sp.]|nr:chemotaxis protein CheB [Pilimelia sp.]
MTVRVAIWSTPEAEGPLRRALQRDAATQVTADSGRASRPPGGLAADVLVVDLESLGPAGLDLIREVMRSDPLPVLALCPGGERPPTAAQARGYGAVDAIGRVAGLATDGELLRQRVRLVSGVSVVRRTQSPPPSVSVRGGGSVVAMAASTGGPAALATVLGGVAGLAAPVLIVQHLHSDFMTDFITWLGGLSALPVCQAPHGEIPRAGQVYVAPADRHLRLALDRTLALSEVPVTVHRPSADELFLSVAKVAGPTGIGVLLTGMGHDGAAGLLAMRRAGARTMVQDEQTSAVYGMPAAALAMGAAEAGVPLPAVAGAILSAARRRPT